MKIFENFDLTNYNSYRIKAICRRPIFFDNENEIKEYYLQNQEKKKNIIR